MSQRYLAPTNMFYRESDPLPPDFPEPSTGDHYFNVVSMTIRVYADGAWRDGTPSDLANFVDKTGDTMSGPLILASTTATLPAQAAPKQYVDDKIIVSTDPPSGSGGFVGQVWITYTP